MNLNDIGIELHHVENSISSDDEESKNGLSHDLGTNIIRRVTNHQNDQQNN